MNGSLTFLFFFFIWYFFPVYLFENPWNGVGCSADIYFWLRQLSVMAAARAPFLKKRKKEMDALFIQKSSFLDCMARLDKHSNIYRFYTNGFCRLLGPVGIFSWRCGHWFSLRIFADVRVHRNSGGPFSLPSTCSACLIPFWFCSPFFFFFKQLLCVQSI